MRESGQAGRDLRRGLFVGRFQPPHLGHIHAVKQILNECDEVIVAIGSAQYSHTFENPFTAGERIEMLRMALREAGISSEKVIIVPVPDVGEHSLWVSRVISFTPRFSKVYTNNQLVKNLFKEAGYEVKPIILFRRKEEMGKVIRKKMIEGGGWESLVPKSVAQFIKEIRGVERLRDSVGKDYPG